MNWRDSIRASDNRHTQRAFPKHLSLRSVSFPIQRSRSIRVTRDVFDRTVPYHSVEKRQLTHSGPQGVSEPSQGCRPLPHSCSWPQNEHQEKCSLPFSTNCVLGRSLGFHSNADPSGSCPDFQPQYMFGPLQARPSCLREHLSQALRPHGCSLPFDEWKFQESTPQDHPLA